MKKRFGALVLSSLVLSAACASSHAATEPKPQPQMQEQPQSQETWEGVELSASPYAAEAESEERK